MNLNNKNKIILSIAALVVLVVVYVTFSGGNDADFVYRTIEVDIGDIRSVVRASGKLNPLNKVEVGTEISGTITEIFVDYNSSVKVGEPLLQIDKSSYEDLLESAKADFDKAKAETLLASSVYNSNSILYKKDLISKHEFRDSQAKYALAKAVLEQAKASLARAEFDITATTVSSPIDGVIISKYAALGQFVSPSSASGALFIVAKNLSIMQLEINVSEADIGNIKEGQNGFFTVDAYKEKMFTGEVRQVRNEPITDENVVTYTVVMKIDNGELLLKPGMTADVRVLIAERKNVMRVPREALRFVPPSSDLVDEKSRDIQSTHNLWILGKGDKLSAIPINAGISDESYVEILEGSSVVEGQEIVVAAIPSKSSSGPLGALKLPQPKRF